MDGSARGVREGRLSAAGQQPLSWIGLPRLAVTGHDPIGGGQNPLAAHLERGWSSAIGGLDNHAQVLAGMTRGQHQPDAGADPIAVAGVVGPLIYGAPGVPLGSYGCHLRAPFGIHPTRLSASPSGLLSRQVTAFFTSAAIRFSSAGVSFVRNQPLGHMVPSSRLAAMSNPNVAYRSWYFEAALKKQMTLPSLA
jgi:hypothetical protein